VTSTPQQVTVSGLTAGYGRAPVLDRLDLEIPAGAITAVLGASGSGKTTLLRILAGFLKPMCGTVRFGDRTVVSAGDSGGGVFLPPERRRVGIVPQEGALFPHLSVRANVGFGLPRGSPARVDEVLHLVGMADRAHARPHELSGGQQQRVALARAMVKEPKVFLFDEPLSNLDAALRTRMRSEIKKLHQQLKTTSIFVTHDQEEAMILSDAIAVMRDGLVVQYGPAETVYRRPEDLYVATFIGKPRMSLLAGELRADGQRGELEFVNPDLRLRWPAGESGPLDTAVQLGIRAEDVQLVGLEPQPDVLDGEVTLVEPLGSDTFVEVSHGSSAITARVTPDLHPRPGDRLRLRLPRQKLHIFDAKTGKRLPL